MDNNNNNNEMKWALETNRNESLEHLYGRQRVGGFKFPRETQHLFLAYSLWVPFFGRIQNGFAISDYTDSSLLSKKEDQKKDHLP